MTRTLVMASTAALLTFAGCSGQTPPAAPSVASTPATTSSSSTSATPTTTTSSSSSSSSSSTSNAGGSSDPSSPPVVTGTQSGTQTLTLDQAFKHEYWEEKVDTPVGGSPQQVIETTTSCSNDFRQSGMLEYRFSNASGTLTVVVQQGLESQTSDGVAEVALFVDGRQTQTQQVSFKEKRTFTTPLTGVNAVKVAVREIYGKSGSCPGQITVLAALTIA